MELIDTPNPNAKKIYCKSYQPISESHVRRDSLIGLSKLLYFCQYPKDCELIFFSHLNITCSENIPFTFLRRKIFWVPFPFKPIY